MSELDLRNELGEYDEDELVWHPDGRVTRKRFLLAGGGAALGASAGGPLIFSGVADAMPLGKKINLPYKANLSAKGHITFWHFWSSPLRRGAIHSAIKQFNSVYPHIKVSDLPVPFGNIFDKIHAAVAAQSGVPDVVVADRPSFWVDARSRVYTPLTSFNAKDKVSGKLFYPFTWYESNVKVKGKNQLYGLPFETDIRVAYINRALLKDAGINPNYVPKTWAQLKSLADKLDHKNGSQYDVLTFWPTDQGLDSWVWANKGDWQNNKQYPTANSAANVATGEWMRSWAERYGGVSAFNYINSQNQPGRDPFSSGHLAIHIDLPTYQDFTLNSNGVKFVPKSGANLYPYWNVADVPAGPGAKPYSFSGGFALGSPRFDHRSKANQEAAWEFIKFMSLVGQLTFEQYAGNIPAVIAMNHNGAVSHKPNWAKFIAALKYGHPKTRNTYDPQYPGDVEGPAQDKIMSGTPAKTALDEAQAQALANMKRNGGP